MRVNVNLSEDMVNRVDRIASDYGVPRASLLSVFIGQSVTSYERGLDLAKQLFEDESMKEKIIKAANV